MIELVTDRTQSHVDRLNLLKAKGWANLTDSEKKEWYANAAKGAYNYTDLNRVESVVAEVAEPLGLNLTTKTDWTVRDVPTAADMNRYLGNIQAIAAACSGVADCPSAPASMSALTFAVANTIEKILEVARKVVELVTTDVWEKFDCVVSGGYYVQSTPSTPNSTGTYVNNVGRVTLYAGYEFIADTGFVGTGLETFTIDSLDVPDIVGMYLVRNTEVGVVTSATVTQSNGKYHITIYYDRVAVADWVERTYKKGNTSYGKITVGEGELPENGTLVDGSVEEGYCALLVSTSYYYYTKIDQ